MTLHKWIEEVLLFPVSGANIKLIDSVVVEKNTSKVQDYENILVFLWTKVQNVKYSENP